MSIYDYTLKNGLGEDVSLADYQGKVLMIVNTATGCAFTPQYEQLEDMYEKYHDKGLEIIDIPCNQFMNQAPGTNEEITTFCRARYNTKFPQMKKSDVNGANELPLYTYLKSQQGFNGFGKGKAALLMKVTNSMKSKEKRTNADIKWNFTKFVVDREGNVVARFEPSNDMADVDKFVAGLL